MRDRPARTLRAWAAIWATSARVMCSTPRIWLFPLLTWVVLLLAAELAIYFVAGAQTSRERVHVVNMLHAQHLRLEGEMLAMQSGLMTMRAALTQTPAIAELNRNWATIMTPLASGYDGHGSEATGMSSLVQSFLVPLGYVAATWPTAYLPFLLNFDVMAPSSPYQEIFCYLPLLPAGTPSLSGPFRVSPEASVFIMAMAVVMPNNGTPTSWGMDMAHRVPYDTGAAQELDVGGVSGDSRRCVEVCGDSCSAIQTNGSVFWGYLISLVDLSVVEVILRAQETIGLKLALFRVWDFSTAMQDGHTEKLQIFPHPDEGGALVHYTLCTQILILDIEWELCCASWAGFENMWKVPLMIVMPFILLLLCFLLLLVCYYAESRRRMLRAMLPRKVVDVLALGGTYAEMFSDTTVVFADIVSYTALSNDLSPHEVVELLACIFAEFDDIVDRHHLHKAGTIGDAYILMGGALEPDEPRDAAIRCARCALEMVEFVGGRTFFPGGKPYLIQIRVGLNTGDLMTAVISNKVPLMTIIGDTVNVAARMQTNAHAQGVHMTEATAALLRGCDEFKIQPRGGCMDIKGKGQMTTYYLGHSTEETFPTLATPVDGDAPHAQDGSPERVPAPTSDRHGGVGDVSPGALGGLCCWGAREPYAAKLPRNNLTTGCTSTPHTRPPSTIPARHTRHHSTLQTPLSPTRATRSEPSPSPLAPDSEADDPGAGNLGAPEFDAGHSGTPFAMPLPMLLIPRLSRDSATQTHARAGPSSCPAAPSLRPPGSPRSEGGSRPSRLNVASGSPLHVRTDSAAGLPRGCIGHAAARKPAPRNDAGGGAARATGADDEDAPACSQAGTTQVTGAIAVASPGPLSTVPSDAEVRAREWEADHSGGCEPSPTKIPTPDPRHGMWS
ncbi:hypothetical protein FOA52_014279 [Chlamydomonas sp. UWO 241]|nr:hypothetical protein FOA52_014279 [Chlamydomonas sp. UWO 241]